MHALNLAHNSISTWLVGAPSHKKLMWHSKLVSAELSYLGVMASSSKQREATQQSVVMAISIQQASW